jgi:hypothetical protein
VLAELERQSQVSGNWLDVAGSKVLFAPYADEWINQHPRLRPRERRVVRIRRQFQGARRFQLRPRVEGRNSHGLFSGRHPARTPTPLGHLLSTARTGWQLAGDFRRRDGRLRACLVAFLEGSGPVGPEQLIKMASGQLPGAYGMSVAIGWRLQPPASNQRFPSR